MKTPQPSPTLDNLTDEQKEAVGLFLALAGRELFLAKAKRILLIPLTAMLFVSGYWFLKPYFSHVADTEPVSQYLLFFNFLMTIVALFYLFWSHRSATLDSARMLFILKNMGVSGEALADIVRESSRRFRGSRLDA